MLDFLGTSKDTLLRRELDLYYELSTRINKVNEGRELRYYYNPETLGLFHEDQFSRDYSAEIFSTESCNFKLFWFPDKETGKSFLREEESNLRDFYGILESKKLCFEYNPDEVYIGTLNQILGLDQKLREFFEVYTEVQRVNHHYPRISDNIYLLHFSGGNRTFDTSVQLSDGKKYYVTRDILSPNPFGYTGIDLYFYQEIGARAFSKVKEYLELIFHVKK